MKVGGRMRLDETVTREWLVDPEELRRDFGYDLSQDGVDLNSDRAVIEACWEEGVRDPYFELQDENTDEWVWRPSA